MTPEQIHEASEIMKNKYLAELPPDEDSKPSEVEEPVVAVDLYDEARKKGLEESTKSYPRGASTLTKKLAEEALNGLAKQKKKVEADSNYWLERGDKERAKMTKDQYMEECFLPAVEMVIIASTPDEVLNSRDILREFDKLTFEYGPGYTASYIRTAYGPQLGNASNQSDGYVKDAVSRITYLANSDQIRAAYGLAKKVREEIDNGNHMASGDDYALITRVATID